MIQPTAAGEHSEVRTYWGRNEAEATAAFQSDALELAASGYRPTSQVWNAPPSRVRIVLPPLILFITAQLIFGINGAAVAALFGIIYIGWMATQARGTLNVTLTRRDTPR